MMFTDVRVIKLILLNLTIKSETFVYWGYPSEVHKVTTTDGYILTLIRVPHGKYGPTGALMQLKIVIAILTLYCHRYFN